MNFLSELHFWSTREDVTVKPTDLGALKYFSKKELNDGYLYNSKKSYCEQRGITWNPVHKRPFKIKDTLKELEDALIRSLKHEQERALKYERERVLAIMQLQSAVLVHPALLVFTIQ